MRRLAFTLWESTWFSLFPRGSPMLDHSLELGPSCSDRASPPTLPRSSGSSDITVACPPSTEKANQRRETRVMLGRNKLFFDNLFFFHKKDPKGQPSVYFQTCLLNFDIAEGTSMEPGIRRANMGSYFRDFPDYRGDINLIGR